MQKYNRIKFYMHFQQINNGRMYIVSPNYNNKSRLLSYCKIISIKLYNYVGPKAIIQRENLYKQNLSHKIYIHTTLNMNKPNMYNHYATGSENICLGS